MTDMLISRLTYKHVEAILLTFAVMALAVLAFPIPSGALYSNGGILPFFACGAFLTWLGYGYLSFTKNGSGPLTWLMVFAMLSGILLLTGSVIFARAFFA